MIRRDVHAGHDPGTDEEPEARGESLEEEPQRAAGEGDEDHGAPPDTVGEGAGDGHGDHLRAAVGGEDDTNHLGSKEWWVGVGRGSGELGE